MIGRNSGVAAEWNTNYIVITNKIAILKDFYITHSQSPNNGILTKNVAIFPSRQSVFPSEL